MSPILLVFSLLKLASGLSVSEKKCIQSNTEILNNKFLIGQWYKVYKFSLFSDFAASTLCIGVNITRATPEEVEDYKEAHGTLEPIQFDASALICEEDDYLYNGMLTGGTQVKFFVWEPMSLFLPKQVYETRVYKKITSNYMLFNTCAVQKTKWLLSRKKEVTEKELNRVIDTIDEVKNLQKKRFCV